MYSAHVPVINLAMRSCPDVFARGVMFAVLSIRQPVTRVPEQLDEWLDKQEHASCLFGFKREAHSYLREERGQLWADVCAIPRDNPRAAILKLLEVPGLGIVKAGFVAQFLGFDVACLDSRNVAREGRKPRAFRTDGKKPAQLARKVDRYLAETGGHAERYWDEWCEDAAGAHNSTALAISALHLAIVPANTIPF